ncbi:GNAT acetyltransferase 2-domain-containing protein [Blastocladiella britannica]|nr:GNAT acetyltransferase 2-domain-containing protein [Blastocladiella britannica]
MPPVAHLKPKKGAMASLPAAADGSAATGSASSAAVSQGAGASQQQKSLHHAQTRKKVDPRVRTVLQNAIAQNQRSFFVIVGDRGRDQIVNLHLFLSKARPGHKAPVLWCYKKELGFTSHRKKRMRQIKRAVERGTRDPDRDDPFELFISSADIRYTYYKETQKILGNTYGMCVLQDFEALTPNLLARTVETVEGGGVIVLLLKTMASLKQLYTMAMDVHSRYRTEAHQDLTARFNERFLLSLSGCDSCLVVDDELNVLPLSRARDIAPAYEGTDPTTAAERMRASHPAAAELRELQESLKETQPVGALVGCTVTRDQAKAILTFIEAIADKSLRSTVALTAARGRGKSAALGLAMAAAIAYGYSNVFVTSPSPENLKTLFEFVFKGLDALGYEEHLDYNLVQSTNPALNKAIVRVNIFRNHRQTIQYIHPEDAAVLGQAELLVIDEAAAIPLPLVRKLLGPYLIFMASTVHGYEGTGRSLSLKLIQSLRQQSAAPSTTADAKEAAASRTLREVTLEQPIRYGDDDPVESWLNRLLCLDATVTKTIAGCPDPAECTLYSVSRDTLFSHHPVSEAFLQRMMALYVSSHYKNTPNDLQLMSDAPAHRLFVLLPPATAYTRDGAADEVLPEPLVVMQVCLEGQISRSSVRHALSRGVRSDGDLIPWCMAQQFQDDGFAGLSGARVVRIATHPDYMGMGYGSVALQQLEQYYRGAFDLLDSGAGASAVMQDGALWKSMAAAAPSDSDALHHESIGVRSADAMPPLLVRLSQRPPERLDWLGVSYGLTRQLFKFWKRSGYHPLYLRQTANELTGEHTCVMVKSLAATGDNDAAWVATFSRDFCQRFSNLLSYEFRKFDSVTCISILDAARGSTTTSKAPENAANDDGVPVTASSVDAVLSPHDVKRLEAYAGHVLDYHVILDLVPVLARLYFSRAAVRRDIELSGLQQSMLLGLGLQHKSITELEAEFSLPSAQLMALFLKVMRKFSGFLNAVQSRAVESEMAAAKSIKAAAVMAKTSEGEDAMDTEEATENGRRSAADEWEPLPESLTAELDDAAEDAEVAMSEHQRAMLDSINLAEYSVGGNDQEWAAATKAGAKAPLTRVAVKSDRAPPKHTNSDSAEGGAASAPPKKRKAGEMGGNARGGGGGSARGGKRPRK